MRSVNQSIGRAIRHIGLSALVLSVDASGDYAAILLLDERYATQRIQRRLPSWIQRVVNVTPQVRFV